MNNALRSPARLLILLLLLSAPAFLYLFHLPFLVAFNQHQEPVLMLPLHSKKEFALGYVHSVHKTPVQEKFFIGSGDNILLVSTSFKSLGAGIPFAPEEGKWRNDNGRFILTGLNREFKEINLRAMPVAKQFLLINDSRFCFNDYFSPGAPIRLKVIRCSMAQYLCLNMKLRKE